MTYATIRYGATHNEVTFYNGQSVDLGNINPKRANAAKTKLAAQMCAALGIVERD